LHNPEAIGEADVRNFRHEVFADGIVTRTEAVAVFAINSAIANKCDSWSVFFVEALCDYTVEQAEPRGYVSVENAQWLIDQITQDGVVESRSELELLIKIIEKAKDCPQALSGFALSQIGLAVIEGKGDILYGRKLTPGVLGNDEVELIRRVLYGYGGENGISISKAEAEVLFDLNDKTIEAQNHPSWSDLFVKAIANYLMAVSGYQSVDRKEAIRREEWLDDTQIDVAGCLANSLRSIATLFSREGFSDAFGSDGDRMQDAWKKRNETFAINQAMSSEIDDAEGVWLAWRIGRDGVVHSNEKALLRFIKEESPRVHPAIKQLIDKIA